MKTSLLFHIILLSSAAALCAGEANPDKTAKEDKTPLVPSTWRPFKELPDVLFYEGFEHVGSVAEHGKLSDENAPPGGHVWKLESNTNESYMQLHVMQTPLRIPQGLNPNQIFVQFSIFADEPGSVTVKCVHLKGEYTRDTPIPKAKAWGVVTLKLADMRNKESHPEPGDVLKEFEVHVHPPRGKKEVPKVWIDDLIITLNSNPADVRPRLMVAEKRRLDMEKQLERDGSSYTMAINDFLKNAIKTSKIKAKAKRVLVIGPTPEATQAWTKQLGVAAAKLKDASGYVFEAAIDPSATDKAIGGLGDARTLLLCNLQQNPEIVLLVGGVDEVLGGGRPSESFRIAAERAMDAGTVPVVVVPSLSKADQKEKLAQFVKTMEGLCNQWGVPLVDANFITKAKGELDAATPGTPTFEKSVAQAMAAIKHVHDSLLLKE